MVVNLIVQEVLGVEKEVVKLMPQEEQVIHLLLVHHKVNQVVQVHKLHQIMQVVAEVEL